MAKRWDGVKHEITLVAFDALGIYDIVETSNHYASHFMRRWFRNPEVTKVATRKPGEHFQERVHTIAR